MKEIPVEWTMASAGLCIGLVYMWFLVPVINAGWIKFIPPGMAILCYTSVVLNRKEDF